MKEIRNYLYEVQVWYVDASNPGFVFFNDIEGTQTDPSVHVAPGVQIISFRLNTAVFEGEVDLATVTQAELSAHKITGREEAAFTTDPIQWVDAAGGPFDLPTDAPANMVVQRIGPTRCDVVNSNSSMLSDFKTEFPMRMIVMYKGNIEWSPDPTIVNVPELPPT
ncbi:MAG: hypothetical protein QNK37_09935 [Acidobacteriota bacterium]|nr:hypothetical protein [Acidobacteriota bacterium]